MERHAPERTSCRASLEGDRPREAACEPALLAAQVAEGAALVLVSAREGTVVNHDHLERARLLGGKRFEHAAERAGRVTRRDDDAALGHAGDDIGLAGVDRVADVDRVDAARPIESVGFEYFAEQSRESRSPERTDSWMLAVSAAEPPREQSTQTTSFGGLTERPA